jgi:DNA-binding transcriptional MocR family regulator
VIGPDLRIALVAGDPLTIARIEGRQGLQRGWISHILQQLASALLADQATTRILRVAERVYTRRRQALISALARHGVTAIGESGLGIWIPLRDEAAAARELFAQGWSVSPGERYRHKSEPGIRVTTASLEPEAAKELARTLAEILNAPAATYAG